MIERSQEKHSIVFNMPLTFASDLARKTWRLFKVIAFRKKVTLTLVFMFLALSAYRSVLRVSSYDPLAGLAWAIMTVRQLPPKES